MSSRHRNVCWAVVHRLYTWEGQAFPFPAPSKIPLVGTRGPGGWAGATPAALAHTQGVASSDGDLLSRPRIPVVTYLPLYSFNFRGI